MGCCGSKRQQMAGQGAGRALGGVAPVSGAMATQPGVVGVALVYVGTAPLTVTGSVTARRYQFANAGARVVVDARDAPGFAAMALLRRV